MKNTFKTYNMWGIINSSETILLDDMDNLIKHWIWKKNDNLVKAMIMQCVKANLVIKVAHTKCVKESWDVFATEFSQTGSGLIMLWFN